MKLRTVLMYALLLCAGIVVGQNKTTKTYAVVIGISSYENKNIRQLVYSDKDAQLFAQWLQSSSGGNVPLSNIRILLNERATIAAIYNALDWLKEQCNEGDEVYFYFSGHGDVETVDHKNKGYLLAYNTPPHNYPNNAVSIEQLNSDANFLTLQKKAKVTIITDACHSGKLAGDFFKGRQWVAQQLQQVLNNEIRMASCAADEEAAEGEFWDGGRGVFSYYLLRGLYGLADKVKDGQVTFAELQEYINTSIKTDEYLQLLKHKQTPVTDGNPQLILSKVDTALAVSFQLEQEQKDTILLQPIDVFFKHAANYPLESFIDFDSLPVLDENNFPVYILDLCIEQDSVQKEAARNGVIEYFSFEYADTLNLLKKQLLTDVSLRKQFIEKFTELAHNSAQSMINAYLNGEETELEKRQYYYSGARNYNDFLPVIKTALRLIPPNHHLAEVLQTNLHYLSGVLARLNMAVSKKTDSLLKTAFRQLYKTLELQPYAAYVHNELANLYVHQKKFDSAQYHFDFAAALAPAWAIPWSNQIRMNMMLKNYTKANRALQKADSLQPNLSYVYMNAGLLMERENHLQEAFSYYARASKLNPVHYLPFERLAYLYVNAIDYEKANTLFYKAASLKNDFAINESYFYYGIELGGVPKPGSFEKLADSCFGQMPGNLVKQWPLALLVYSLSQQQNMSNDSYISTLRVLLKEHPSLPLVHHYLGKKLLETGNLTEAAILLKQAAELHKADSVLQADVFIYIKHQRLAECIKHLLPLINYEVAEDFYLLAKAYELQQNFSGAAGVYQQIMELENKQLQEQALFKNYIANSEYAHSESFTQVYYYEVSLSPNITQRYTYEPSEYLLKLYDEPVKITSAVKLMKLYEQLQNYEKAEEVLLQQVVKSRNAGDLRRKAIQEKLPGTWSLFSVPPSNYFWLNANSDLEITIHDFYNRMIKLQPRNYYWKQQAASFLYKRLKLAYQQMPQDQYLSFTNSITEFAYPWQSSVEPFELQTANWPAPALKDTIVISLEPFHPVNKALDLLQSAQKFSPLSEPEIQTAIMFADLFNWMGNTAVAKQWYEYVLEKQPQEAETRLKLARLLFHSGYYTAAQKHSDILERQNQLDPAGIKHLIFLHTIAGNFARAITLINKTPALNKADSCFLLLQRTTILLLQKKYTEAITLLQKKFPYTKPVHQNWIDSTEMEALQAKRFYVVARSYALLKQEAAAVHYLKKALQNGFCLVQVLKYDPAWAQIKKGRNRTLFQIQSNEAVCTGEEGFQIWMDPRHYRIPGEK